MEKPPVTNGYEAAWVSQPVSVVVERKICVFARHQNHYLQLSCYYTELPLLLNASQAN
jgi:hypothetical protein